MLIADVEWVLAEVEALRSEVPFLKPKDPISLQSACRQVVVISQNLSVKSPMGFVRRVCR